MEAPDALLRNHLYEINLKESSRLIGVEHCDGLVDYVVMARRMGQRGPWVCASMRPEQSR